MDKLEYTLIQNSLDYFRRAVDAYYDKDEKLVILFLWSGILLLLKEILRKEHPALLYEKLDEVLILNKETKTYEFNDGFQNKRKTVGFEEIKYRLRKFVNSNAKVLESKNIKLLNKLRDYRNQIEHYSISVEVEIIQEIFHQILPLIHDIIEDDLGMKIIDVFSEIWGKLIKVEEFYKNRVEKLPELLSKYGQDWHDIADGDDELPEFQCENCDNGKMIINNTDRKTAECLICQHTREVTKCQRCGTYFISYDSEEYICENCYENIMSED